MGLITQQLTDGDKFVKPSNECTGCSTNKAVAGMENKDASLTSRDERGAGTATEKTTENGKRYILADGPASNLFTKALQVKYAKSDSAAELSNKRPTQAQIESSDKEVSEVSMNTSNESAAQDAQMFASQNNGGVLIQDINTNTSRFRISRTMGNPREPVTVNPVHAFKQLADTGIDVDFILVRNENANGQDDIDVVLPEIVEKNNISKNSVGRVDGVISNENLEIMSVQVIVKYK